MISLHEMQESGKYERASTAVMNSYIGPVTNNYLKSLQKQLEGSNYKKPLYIMQSNGGVIRAESALEQPVKTSFIWTCGRNNRRTSTIKIN